MNISFAQWIKLNVAEADKERFDHDILEKIWSYEKAILLDIPEHKRQKYKLAIANILEHQFPPRKYGINTVTNEYCQIGKIAVFDERSDNISKNTVT